MQAQPNASSVLDPYAAVRARLQEVLGSAATPTVTGLLLADVLYWLFELEAREGDADLTVSAWLSAPPNNLCKLGEQFVELVFDYQNIAFQSPGGQGICSYVGGSILLGAEMFGLDVDRPGLHPTDQLPDFPGGSNLELLKASIGELAKAAGLPDFGSPEVVSRNDPADSGQFLQFPPFKAAAGAKLQHNLFFAAWGESFCAFSVGRVRKLAANIVADMRYLVEAAPQFAANVRALRGRAERALRTRPGTELHAITLELSAQLTPPPPVYGVELETWDRTYRRGIVVRRFSNPRQPQFALDRLASSTGVEWLKSKGATGTIEPLAAAIVNAAPEGPVQVLERLSREFETELRLDVNGLSLHFRLFWDNGCICASTRYNEAFSVSRGQIKIEKQRLPEQVLLSLPGEPLYRVFDEPFSIDTPIVEARFVQNQLIIDIRNERLLVNCETGKIWRMPPAPLMHGEEAEVPG